MSGLVRKLLIYATVDGLILQSAPQRNHKPANEHAIKIRYKSNKITPLLQDDRPENISRQVLEVHGIVGLLKVASTSFLISISGREQVAIISGQPIYSITEVALIPLSSRAEAEEAIVRASGSQLRQSTSQDHLKYHSHSEDDVSDESASFSVTPDPDPQTPAIGYESDVTKKPTSVVQDVISRQGFYGRFTDKWFSKTGWDSNSRVRQGMSSEDDPDKANAKNANPAAHDPRQHQDIHAHLQVESQDTVQNDDSRHGTQLVAGEVTEGELAVSQIPLLPKLLATTKIFLGSKSFYFSYEHNLSRNVKSQQIGTPLPLHRTYDPAFFWNKHLLQPFIDAGQEQFTVPLIQGFVGQREFKNHAAITTGKLTSQVEANTGDIDQSSLEALPSEQPAREQTAPSDPLSRSFLLTVISRRSVNRAGLRYHRRGTDEYGHVANGVETEQILCPASWHGVATPDQALYSYVQYRGSMPLFFSQSPYSFKPMPVFRGTTEENLAAFKSHFEKLTQLYGKIQAINLVEKKGKEGSVGNLYQQLAEKSEWFNSKPDSRFSLIWFDFHSMCKAMKFDNVVFLLNELRDKISSFGWTCQVGDGLEQQQSGVFRTNCMDCLDRTNVVQSAMARLILEEQLRVEGFEVDLQNDLSTSWFNSVWADNGDAISRQYAGTAALKGDFTRTRKRNIGGALTDLGLTLNRYYTNIVNDYFMQAMIDFLLGNADEHIFIDFEADMKSHDYAIDLGRVRQNAIETCVTICIGADGDRKASEQFIAGWALQCPQVSGTVNSRPLEECILLLTNTALFFCRMDWSTEKVKAFEKINLDKLTAISRGTYITHTFASRDQEERKNVGFVIKYLASANNLTRVNTRSLTSNDADDTLNKLDREGGASSSAHEKLLAFKALPSRSSYTYAKTDKQNAPSEGELVKTISDAIVTTANQAKAKSPLAVTSGQTLDPIAVEEKDIVSLAEARRNTGYFEQIGYSLKKLVWAG